MRTSRSLRRFLPCLLLAAGALADELDDWLASAMRVSTEALKPCPVSCRQLGDNTSKGFLYSDAVRLAACNETMLLDMAIHNDKTAPALVRACTADYDSSAALKPAFLADDEKASLCTTANQVLEEVPVHMHQPGGDNLAGFSASHLIAAGRQISNHLATQIPSCTDNAMEFAYFQTSAIGVFAGAEIHQHGVTSDVLKRLLQHAQDEGLTRTTVVQLCASGHGRAADYSLGVVATSAENIGFIREAVRTWASGGCVSQPSGEGSMSTEGWMKVTIRVPAAIPATNGTNSTSRLNSGSPAVLGPRSRLRTRANCRTTTVQSGEGCWVVAQRCGISQDDLARYNRANLCTTLIKDEIVCCSSGTLPSTLPPGNADGTCKTRTVVSGDDCGSLASKCGISGADFIKVNTKANLCSALVPGQQVCCTAGNYPDLKPKPDANGNCATYLTKKEDTCSAIAAARDLTVSDLESFNKNTWGWNGCDPKVFYPDFKMCVSTGTAPMPAIVDNAMCGPTMPGTTQPPAGTNISTLNPCPLSVCCNTWGQCGMTDDFCVISKSATGAPGTSAPGTSGCISNCGRDIIRGSFRQDKIRVAYFEAWNSNRKCMHIFVDQVDTSVYTHIHFAFANVTRGDFRIEITDPVAKEQFETFKTLTGVKRILSLGGWDFSALPRTFMILREAVLPANRQTFKNNIIAFLNEHNVDRIDLDWEYPGMSGRSL
ncbi:killer toxin subunits alpha/beta [Parachaetomium inaequale]|uniref:Killer toxin subunits alpha/beta n=1 Tax=Parachaetomium inaequale TaxID=2588326 RepID=A0AAN6P633_9PEZI|nr:killer toxin subunits alpha/beta [Parachaetomium inaequale]